MIRTLTGTITKLADTWVVLEVQGVGYLVGCPVLQHQLHEGMKITLHTHLAVRETALDLYGFPEHTELQMFELLLGIPKVGPKSALQILTQATPTLLTEATQKNDPNYLQKLSSIGKKTCENIVQHLTKKLNLLPTISTTTDLSLTSVQTDAIDALIALGYDTNTARDTILAMETTQATVNSLVTQALKRL